MQNDAFPVKDDIADISKVLHIAPDTTFIICYVKGNQ